MNVQQLARENWRGGKYPPAPSLFESSGLNFTGGAACV